MPKSKASSPPLKISILSLGNPGWSFELHGAKSARCRKLTMNMKGHFLVPSFGRAIKLVTGQTSENGREDFPAILRDTSSEFYCGTTYEARKPNCTVCVVLKPFPVPPLVARMNCRLCGPDCESAFNTGCDFDYIS